MFSIRKAYCKSVGEGIVLRCVFAMFDALRNNASSPIILVTMYKQERQGAIGVRGGMCTFFDCFDEEVEC